MPERLDVAIAWESRDTLLSEIRHLESAAGIRKAFQDVGATRPVKLSDADSALLLDVLERWLERVSRDGLPPGIWDLRRLLADDPARA